MTTALDLTLPATAAALLAELGATAALLRDAHSSSPKGDTSPVTTTSYACKVTPPAPYRRGYAPGVTETNAALTCFLAADGFATTPAVGDRLSLAGKYFEIVAVSPVQSGDAVCVWQLDVKG